MKKSEIATFIHFNFWANERILSACERISTDEFTRPATPDPGWGSLRGILVHTLDTEYGWRSVCQALPANEILKASSFADVAALKSRWELERAAWFEYLAQLNPEQLDRGSGADPQAGPKVWQTLCHVVMHGIQHRSEAAVILTGYGQSPGELDFDLFLLEDLNSDQTDR